MAFHLNTILYKFLSLLLLNSLKLIVCIYVSGLIPFRSKILLKPHPDWYLLGVHLKFPDEHPCPLYLGVPPPPRALYISLLCPTPRLSLPFRTCPCPCPCLLHKISQNHCPFFNVNVNVYVNSVNVFNAK